ncbi:hypothetical protein GCM10010402_21360 [Actinomadura luteofluorescens]
MPPIACACAAAPSPRASIAAMAVSAGTPIHWAALDSDSAIRSRRNGPIDESDETPGGGGAAGCGRGAPVLVMSVRVSA